MALVYGIHAVDSLLRRNPGSVRRLWLQQGRQDRRLAAIEALASGSGLAISRVSRAELDRTAGGRHQGVVAEVAEAGAADGGAAQAESANLLPESRLLRLLDDLERPALLLVLDGVTDPHNLGACLRSADAAGVDAVIVPKDKSASITPTVRKVACGAAETVPFVRVTNLSRTLQALKERGIWLYGAAGEAENSIYDSELTDSLALVMGSEGKGMRRLTREQCDFLVHLPMAGSVSSLNVSVATGICLFEIARQRRAGAAAEG
ncbi:MAG: 23S rRNA (guanosine(2251)-2'-O)-methyltransferase RlmB [Halioglobus sp.]|nr:23S rRNA (guanosine(2251)-2'-O)-methyltransferase RlmB [Halioglobus sp.]